MNEKELVELLKNSKLCPTNLPKYYTQQNFSKELGELQTSSELCLLKILQKYT